MPSKPNNTAIAGSLVLIVFLWGGSNVGTKWLVASWPPVWTGGMRFLCAGILLLGVLKFTCWLGALTPLTPPLRRQLWLRGGLFLAVYIVDFNWALRFTAASHVALYLGASPVWALWWEEKPSRTLASARCYGAALLAACGVVVLFWPAFHSAKTGLIGEFLGIAASFLWAAYSRQARLLGGHLAGAEVAAHTMWMAGVWLLPFGLAELLFHPITITPESAGIMAFCIILGGVLPYALWNNALRHWRTSKVMLFNNLIPMSTTLWAFCFLKEPLTSTFWLAMILIVAGVVLGQADWSKIFGVPEGL